MLASDELLVPDPQIGFGLKPVLDIPAVGTASSQVDLEGALCDLAMRGEPALLRQGGRPPCLSQTLEWHDIGHGLGVFGTAEELSMSRDGILLDNRAFNPLACRHPVTPHLPSCDGGVAAARFTTTPLTTHIKVLREV